MEPELQTHCIAVQDMPACHQHQAMRNDERRSGPGKEVLNIAACFGLDSRCSDAVLHNERAVTQPRDDDRAKTE